MEGGDIPRSGRPHSCSIDLSPYFRTLRAEQHSSFKYPVKVSGKAFCSRSSGNKQSQQVCFRPFLVICIVHRTYFGVSAASIECTDQLLTSSTNFST